MSETDERLVAYTRMDEGTAEDYARLKLLDQQFRACPAERVLAHLELSNIERGHRVTQYEHALQTATRAHRAGECEEFVFAALLHDMGDTLAVHNHADLAADIIRPYVSRYTYWMVKQHAIFQGHYYWDKVGKNKDERDRFRDHPAFAMTERFCGEYDQLSFDPEYDSLPIDFFAPLVRRIFSRTPWGEHTELDWPVD